MHPLRPDPLSLPLASGMGAGSAVLSYFLGFPPRSGCHAIPTKQVTSEPPIHITTSFCRATSSPLSSSLIPPRSVRTPPLLPTLPGGIWPSH